MDHTLSIWKWWGRWKSKIMNWCLKSHRKIYSDCRKMVKMVKMWNGRPNMLKTRHEKKIRKTTTIYVKSRMLASFKLNLCMLRFFFSIVFCPFFFISLGNSTREQKSLQTFWLWRQSCNKSALTTKVDCTIEHLNSALAHRLHMQFRNQGKIVSFESLRFRL